MFDIPKLQNKQQLRNIALSQWKTLQKSFGSVIVHDIVECFLAETEVELLEWK